MASNTGDVLGNFLFSAVDAVANKPVKTSETTFSMPTEYADMKMRRDAIGQARQALADSLRNRETRGYTFGNALANLGGQTIPGQIDWLGGLRAAGGAYISPTNAAIDRLTKEYDMARADLADALMYDKAMGSRQTSIMGYEGGNGTLGMGAGMGSQQAQYETTNENLADLYKTIVANPMTFSSVGGLNQTEEARGIRRAVEGRGIETLGHNEFQYLQSIMPKGFSTAINTVKEQEMMRPYTTMFAEGAGSAKKAAIKNMVSSIYDFYANEAKRQGFEMPISREDYINSRLENGRVLNPKFYTGKSTDMYLPQEDVRPSGTTSIKQKAADTAQRVADFMKGTV